jgi:hypothetical protein
MTVRLSLDPRLPWLALGFLFVTCIVSQAASNNPSTDWFRRAGYGVFGHYLQDLQHDPQQIQSLGLGTSWEECVREFDTRRFADAMGESGAGYVISTMHQRTRFLIAPNGTFDRLLSYLGHDRLGNDLGAGWGQPGVRYSQADLTGYVVEVNQAGGVVSIDLLLYRDGTLDRSQHEVLKALRPGGLAAYNARAPVPPGNLAFRKPARLLSLEGAQMTVAELEVCE